MEEYTLGSKAKQVFVKQNRQAMMQSKQVCACIKQRMIPDALPDACIQRVAVQSCGSI